MRFFMTSNPAPVGPVSPIASQLETRALCAAIDLESVEVKVEEPVLQESLEIGVVLRRTAGNQLNPILDVIREEPR